MWQAYSCESGFRDACKNGPGMDEHDKRDAGSSLVDRCAAHVILTVCWNYYKRRQEIAKLYLISINNALD